jgi:hypothetical protein
MNKFLKKRFLYTDQLFYTSLEERNIYLCNSYGTSMGFIRYHAKFFLQYYWILHVALGNIIIGYIALIPQNKINFLFMILSIIILTYLTGSILVFMIKNKK